MLKTDYLVKFSKLNVAKKHGHKSPHKVCMLLALIDTFESAQAFGLVTPNQFFLPQLQLSYTGYFELFGKDGDHKNPYFPFFHLKSEGFWNLHAMPGQALNLQAAKTISSFKKLNQLLHSVTLAPELFNYLHDPIYRTELTIALVKNLDDELQQGAVSFMAKDWTQEECYATAQAYFDMLHHDIKGEKVNKAEVYRQVAARLVERTPKAVEFKFQNISAVLLDIGWRYIPGLTPAINYQGLLHDVVCNFIKAQPKLIEQIELEPDSNIQIKTPSNILSVLTNPPERRLLESQAPSYRTRSPIKTNFAQRDAKNRHLGKCGEQFVIEYEKARLNAANRSDLAKEIEWTAKEKGDGTGYDVRSFNELTDQELFIEVKTTNSGIYQPFFISDNELEFSVYKADQYSLYRVFSFNQTPSFFILKGNLKEQLELHATQYRARL